MKKTVHVYFIERISVKHIICWNNIKEKMYWHGRCLTSDRCHTWEHYDSGKSHPDSPNTVRATWWIKRFSQMFDSSSKCEKWSISDGRIVHISSLMGNPFDICGEGWHGIPKLGAAHLVSVGRAGMASLDWSFLSDAVGNTFFYTQNGIKD